MKRLTITDARKHHYAEREYGVTRQELDAFDKWADSHMAQLRASGKLQSPSGKLKLGLVRLWR